MVVKTVHTSIQNRIRNFSFIAWKPHTRGWAHLISTVKYYKTEASAPPPASVTELSGDVILLSSNRKAEWFVLWYSSFRTKIDLRAWYVQNSVNCMLCLKIWSLTNSCITCKTWLPKTELIKSHWQPLNTGMVSFITPSSASLLQLNVSVLRHGFCCFGTRLATYFMTSSFGLCLF